MKITRHRPVAGIENRLYQQVGVAMLQWGHLVASHAVQHAPILSGDLRRAIVVSNVEVFGPLLSIRVGPDSSVSSYAPEQELNTSLGFGRLSIAEGATRPWLRPAFEAYRTIGNVLVRAAFSRAIRG